MQKESHKTDVRDGETQDRDMNSPEALTVKSAEISGQSLTGGRTRVQWCEHAQESHKNKLKKNQVCET